MTMGDNENILHHVFIFIMDVYNLRPLIYQPIYHCWKEYIKYGLACMPIGTNSTRDVH